MEWNKLKHELKYTDDGVEIIFYLPSHFEELSKEFELPNPENNEQKQKLSDYLKSLYPNINICTAKFMVGTLLAASVVLPLKSLNTVHANTTSVEAINSNNITIVMGDYYIKPDVDPYIYNDRAMIPIRAIAEAIEAEVSWDDKTQTAIIKKGSNIITLKIGSDKATLNGKTVQLDVAPQISGSRTMVPFRFVSESIGVPVNWDDSSRTVTVDYNKKYTLDYVIQPGDTLAKIATQFNTSVSNIRLWNNITGDIIYAGQFIRVASPFLQPIRSSMDDMIIKQYHFDTVLGYTVKDYPTHTSSQTSLNKYGKHLSEVSTFTHKIQSDGSLKVDYMQDDTLNLAKQQGLDVMMLVHNAESGGFNKDLGKNVLADSAKRKNLIDNIYNQIQKYGYTGVEIDIENLPPESRENYNQFIIELCQKLQPEGYKVACALPAKTSATGESWLNAYDYETIGRYVDRVLIMSYDQHYAGGSPGPVASIGWVESVAKYTASAIPPSKVLLGIPMYGYDWPVNGGTGKSVTVSTVENYIKTYGGRVEWSESAKSPYYKYKDSNGVNRIVWFDNVQSTQFKFEIAHKYNFQGVGMWRLGLESNEFWNGLQ